MEVRRAATEQGWITEGVSPKQGWITKLVALAQGWITDGGSAGQGWITKPAARAQGWIDVDRARRRGRAAPAFTFALLFACFGALLLPAHEARAQTARLNATLLPSASGASGSQLAVDWNDTHATRLDVELDTNGSKAPLAEQPLKSGMNLYSLPLDSRTAEGSLVLRAKDASGRVLATLKQDIQSPAGNGLSWESAFVGPGMDNVVNAAVVWDDGSGPALYVGGAFVTAGHAEVNGVARWDGHQWSGLTDAGGTGIGGSFSPAVNALVVYDGALYVGGNFTTAGNIAANNIARWDGSTWSALGAGADSWVYSLAVYDDTLVAGGFFTHVDGTPASHIASWNGSAWSALGSGANGTVYVLTSYAGSLIAGGSFGSAGGGAASNIASWNGSAWSALGSGVNNTVRALAEYGGALVAGGNFTQAGGGAANRVASWNGSAWSALGGGVNGVMGPGGAVVSALAVSGSTLIAGGTFIQADAVTVNNIASWDGSAWSALASTNGPGTSGGVFALAAFDGRLIAAGTFTQVGGQPPPVGGGLTVNGVAQWDGNGWATIEGVAGTGVSAQVSTMIVYNGDLIVGGSFTQAGGADAWGIARWDGHSWSPLAGSLGAGVMTAPFDFVSGLAVYNGDLYVGGQFSMAGHVPVNNVARWDGHEWHSLIAPGGVGVDGAVFTLAVYHGDLYAAGSFVHAGGKTVNNVARWDGSDWFELQGPSDVGTDQTVTAMTVFDDAVIIGSGDTAGGVPVNYVARWDGSTWSALGDGLDSSVRAFTEYNGDLYAGGFFSVAGGTTVNHVARWDGSNWSALGGGTGGFGGGIVYALGVFDGALYVGGTFSTAGAVTANGIARWDGSAWSPLDGPAGNGIDVDIGSVFSLLAYDADGSGPVPEKLAVGGTFLMTGGVVNRRLAFYGPDAPLGNLSVTPSAIDFGNAQLPGTVLGPSEVTLFASGNQTVQITAVDEATTPFHRAGGDCPQAPFALPAGGSCTMSFVFVPIAAGDFSQTIVLQNDGASTASFALHGVGVAPPPVITVDPPSLDVELATGATTSREITIGNTGGSALDWHVASGFAGAAVLHPTRGVTLPRTRPLPANVDRARINAGTHPGASLSASAPDAPGDRVVLTESTSMNVVAGNSIACSNPQTGFTSENHFLRTFALGDFGIADDFDVVSVRFGIESLSVDTTVSVNLYTLTGDFVYENMQLIGSSQAALSVEAGTLVDVPVNATVPAGGTLVVEIVAPDLEGSGSGWFYPGSNSAGESAPSYLAAPGCNASEPATMASFGRPDVQLVMSVTGGEPVDCTEPAWLGLDPASGTVAPGSTGMLTANIDTAGLAGGNYTANVCLASNDPTPLLTVVPVDLHVSGDNDVLAASPDTVGYGTVPAGIHAGPAMISLTNTGAVPANVSAVDAAQAPFVRDGGDCPAAPFTLGAGASCTLGYTFEPTVVGDYAQTLHVASDIGNAAVTLTGTGIAGVPSQLALLGGSGQTAMVGAPFAQTLAVQIRDDWNNPVPNTQVTFAAPGSGASAVLSASTAMTDTNGYAGVTAIANAIAGSYTATASGGLGAPVSFSLTNTAAVVDVASAIVADRDVVRAGEMLDYVVTLHNAGSIATTDAAIASTLSPLLDAGAATWLCLGPSESGCTPSGTGDLTESGLALAPSGSVSYLVSAPVRLDADADEVLTSVHATLDGDGNPGDDTASASTPLVIFRDGFEPYRNGADAPLVARSETLTKTTALELVWPAAGSKPVNVVMTADAADGSGFRIEQLNDGTASWVRLVAHDRNGRESAGNWTRVATGALVHLGLAEGGGSAQTSSVVMTGASAMLALPDAASSYRIASTVSLTARASGP